MPTSASMRSRDPGEVRHVHRDLRVEQSDDMENRAGFHFERLNTRTQAPRYLRKNSCAGADQIECIPYRQSTPERARSELIPLALPRTYLPRCSPFPLSSPDKTHGARMRQARDGDTPSPTARCLLRKPAGRSTSSSSMTLSTSLIRKRCASGMGHGHPIGASSRVVDTFCATTLVFS